MHRLLLLSLATVLPAQAVTLRVRVGAGGVERRWSPVAAEFAWPAELAAAAAEADRDRPTPWTARMLEAEGGAEVPCEVLAETAPPEAPRGGELRFLIEHLPAGGSRAFRLELGAGPAAAPASPFTIEDASEARSVGRAGRPLLRHETAFDRAAFEATKKPIWHLFDPASGARLTKGAGGEHSHHRGLFLGWNRTHAGGETYDLWHCPAPGQRHAGHAVPEDVRSPVRAAVTAGTEWLTPADALLARETRTLSFWLQPEDRALLDVTARVAADQRLELRGDPHHAGLHLRLADEVAQRNDARFVFPPGARSVGEDTWTDCPWVGCVATVEGHRVGILFMSHADNPAPVLWSARAYGRFGAFYAADVDAGRPLELRHRLLVWSLAEGGDLEAGECARAYADYRTPVQVAIDQDRR